VTRLPSVPGHKLGIVTRVYRVASDISKPNSRSICFRMELAGIYGVWRMAYGVWYMAYGIWCMGLIFGDHDTPCPMEGRFVLENSYTGICRV
jgi:hypothetical protein